MATQLIKFVIHICTHVYTHIRIQPDVITGQGAPVYTYVRWESTDTL